MHRDYHKSHSRRTIDKQHSTVLTKTKKYLLNVFISLDQTVNALLGGDPDETLSSYSAKCQRYYRGPISWRRPLARIVQTVCNAIDLRHLPSALDNGVGSSDLRNATKLQHQKEKLFRDSSLS
jgi:hypothetical protein